MPVQSFQAKLLYLMIAVLILLQAATLTAVHVSGERMMRRAVSEELRVGSRVLDQILSARGQQLSSAVRLLAADFAFREAIALGDRPTIVSALSNHGNRVDADVALLISLEGAVEADTLGGRLSDKPFPHQALLEGARTRGESSATVTFEGKPYQMVVVPVMAPQPIAWVCLGFVISDEVLAEVKRLTALDVSLLSAPTAAGSRVDAENTVRIGDEDFRTLLHPLATADDSRIDTSLRRSLEEAKRPYRELELQIFALSTIALVAAIFAAIFFARGVSRPLETLAAGAQRIERGDYGPSIDIPQADEIGRLAMAFNRMVTGIAEREEQIRHQATHDALTGLPNRSLFFRHLQQTIVEASGKGNLVAMVIMDVDRFKEINDTLGHHFGDQLLKEVGRRLHDTLRECEIVSRLGGDEFAMTFFAGDVGQARQMAARIDRALDTPFLLAGVSMEVQASMGLAVYPLHADDAATLMKRADIAMYDAKKKHVRLATYEPGRDEHSMRRLVILSELRPAVERGELELHYQPKIDLTTKAMMHAEALVRWRHPVHGIVAPDEFIPLAEQSGNIAIITRWVLQKAIEQCAVWNRSGLELTVAVNLSALDLLDERLAGYIDELLARHALPGSRLVLEITESAVMNDPAHSLKVLRELKTRGITLAIDDYGTGYSSLAHLKRLPVDELKIDKSFVLNLRQSSTDDLVIVRSTIELGHNMGLRVIAEGVENSESLAILRGLGCDMAQGFYVSQPLAAEAFAEWARVRGLRIED